MPQVVEIGIYPIGKTGVDRDEVRKWLDSVGATSFELPLEEEVNDRELLVGLAAKRCYMAFEAGLNPNVTKVRKDWTDYLDNILKSGHGSVVEHVSRTFAIENVSRVFTGELNRHRAGCAISEGSMRYIRYAPEWVECGTCGGNGHTRMFNDEGVSLDAFQQDDDNNLFKIPGAFCEICAGTGKVAKPETGIRFWMPLSICETQGAQYLDPELISEEDRSLRRKRMAMRDLFRRWFASMERFYQEGLDIWAEELAPTSKFAAKKQITSMLRRGIGMGVATGGVWTFNMRAIRHIIAMRSSEAAEEEIAHVFGRIARMMCEQEPKLLGDFYEDDKGFMRPKYVKV